MITLNRKHYKCFIWGSVRVNADLPVLRKEAGQLRYLTCRSASLFLQDEDGVISFTKWILQIQGVVIYIENRGIIIHFNYAVKMKPLISLHSNAADLLINLFFTCSNAGSSQDAVHKIYCRMTFCFSFGCSYDI